MRIIGLADICKASLFFAHMCKRAKKYSLTLCNTVCYIYSCKVKKQETKPMNIFKTMSTEEVRAYYEKAAKNARELELHTQVEEPLLLTLFEYQTWQERATVASMELFLRWEPSSNAA